MRNRQHRMGRREAILTGCGTLATLLAACASTSVASDTTLDIIFTNKGRLTGTFAGRNVDLTAELPASRGTVKGIMAREPVDANWQIAHNSTSGQMVLPVTVDGSLARQAISLNAVFRLMPNQLFDSGKVTGTAGGRSVQAEASSASGESSSSVNVDGSFAGTAFSLYASIAGDLRSGLIRGIVGGKPAQLKARVQSGAIHITGDYSGPSALFVIAACTLLYFLGGNYSA
jgi:hypothetical protein